MTLPAAVWLALVGVGACAGQLGWVQVQQPGKMRKNAQPADFQLPTCCCIRLNSIIVPVVGPVVGLLAAALAKMLLRSHRYVCKRAVTQRAKLLMPAYGAKVLSYCIMDCLVEVVQHSTRNTAGRSPGSTATERRQYQQCRRPSTPNPSQHCQQEGGCKQERLGTCAWAPWALVSQETKNSPSSCTSSVPLQGHGEACCVSPLP